MFNSFDGSEIVEKQRIRASAAQNVMSLFENPVLIARVNKRMMV